MIEPALPTYHRTQKGASIPHYGAGVPSSHQNSRSRGSARMTPTRMLQCWPTDSQLVKVRSHAVTTVCVASRINQMDPTLPTTRAHRPSLQMSASTIVVIAWEALRVLPEEHSTISQLSPELSLMKRFTGMDMGVPSLHSEELLKVTCYKLVLVISWLHTSCITTN